MRTAITLLMIIACARLAGNARGDQGKNDSAVRVDAGRVVNKTTRLMYGSCIEDVNHEIYGGLYAQQIFGESFEEPPRLVPFGWTEYAGRWVAKDGVCSVKAEAGAKLLRKEPA